MTKDQAILIKNMLNTLLAGKYVATSFYTDRQRMEVRANNEKEKGAEYYEYEHNPGEYHLNFCGGRYVTDLPTDFKDIWLDVDNRTIHFKITAGSGEVIYRAFTQQDMAERDDWRMWRDFDNRMRELKYRKVSIAHEVV